MTLIILLLGLLPFSAYALKQGYKPVQLLAFFKTGLRKPAKTYLIMLLIGGAASLWLASGTLPLLISWGLRWISPHWFILFTFCFTWLMTVVIGSAIGTFGMVGILMVAMAAMGDVSIALTAGAVVSAVYLGERSSPMSSCAHLVAEINSLSVYSYIWHNLRYSRSVIAGSMLFYGVMSYFNPLQTDNALELTAELENVFVLTPWSLLPLAVLLIALLLRLPITAALLLSMVAAGTNAIVFQHASFGEVIAYAYFGYEMDTASTLLSHFKATGVFGMLPAVLVVMTASLYTGLLDGTKLLDGLQQSIQARSLNSKPFYATLGFSFMGAALGCSQTFAVLFSHQMVSGVYGSAKNQRQQLATDLANGGVLVSALVPWNIAASIPAALLGCGFAFMPYAVFIYLAPLHGLIWTKGGAAN